MSSGPSSKAYATRRQTLGSAPQGEVFDSQNRRRTVVAIDAMVGQQVTGQAFVNQYSTIFYQQNGFREQAFPFTLLTNVAGVTAKHPYCTHQHPYSNSHAVLGMCASARMKQKTSLLSCCISILTTFATSPTLPYLLSAPYVAPGGRVGFVYGPARPAPAAMTFFLVPELNGRSLDEVDQLFAVSVPLWKFKGTGTVPLKKELARGHEEEDGKDSSAASVECVDDWAVWWRGGCITAEIAVYIYGISILME
ncbi:hypothetical protein AAE478_002927 [Parahypoxylon ruwenzoriense]